MELVADLSSSAFLNAFSRFTSTRGLCKHVFTDRGTNFVGANSELNAMYKMLQSDEIEHEIKTMCRDDRINWHFYPPGAPHFGGLHEAAVKSAKFHLRRVMATASLTYEELNTLVKQVEAVLNSRPLCTKQTSNDDEIFILTPGHFLIGRSLVSVPETDIREKKVSLKQRWELLVQLKQHFWNRWSKDYLQTLQHRRKWTNKSRNIEVGEIVIIRDDNVAPLKWKKGRVAEVHPGSDGLVRVVTLKTSTGFLKRPITKICPLPIETLQIEPSVQGGENVDDT